MKRKIISIDENKCNGCGLCARACHEGAIGMVNGKAKLLRDDYCDGLGDCLPVCPTGAITFVEREAAAYDAAAVERNKKAAGAGGHAHHAGGCPGSAARQFFRGGDGGHGCPGSAAKQMTGEGGSAGAAASELRQWPVQIRLAPVLSPMYDGAHLLIAADCAAYAYGGFHADFMRGKITLIGCPKLDPVEYAEKLTEILRGNDIQSVTVARMEVPCCGGIARAAAEAVENCGKALPYTVVTISTDGRILP